MDEVPWQRRPGPLLFAALFLSAVASLAAVAALLGEASPPRVAVELADLTFAPASVTIPAGRAVTLDLRNAGNLEHDWSVDALRLSPNVAPGQATSLAISAPAGVYEVYCSLPGHREAGMVGRLEVR